MFSSVMSAAICGVDCIPVRVEADVSSGLPVFNMVGYLSSQVREAQERVRTAIRNAKISLPPKRITVNLAPADVRKEGNRFDLPIAAALLAAFGFIESEKLRGVMLAGELGLDGRVNSVRGILPLAETAAQNGCWLCIVPRGNCREARIAGRIKVLGVESLKEFLDASGKEKWGVCSQKTGEQEKLAEPVYNVDFEEIQGQETVKRAAVIAAAGFHNFLISGPQGAGKTMIARRIPTILPRLSREESLEVSRIYSVAGLLSEEQPFMSARPFRAPHHTITPQALAGGGRIPRPGEITLSHRGVLFLDEIPEFSHNSIEILRQPLEEHKVRISRTIGSYEFPAHCMLVAAMNHCPCGRYPDLKRCTCTDRDISRYAGKISGPILDRIDICAEAACMTYQEISGGRTGQSSAELMKEVEKAFLAQQDRYEGLPVCYNSELSGKQVEKYCSVSREGRRLLEKAYEKMNLSARAYHKILKTARTIADLDGEEEIKESQISEAVCYRGLEKRKV